jgi:hypothetical protein
MIRYSLIFSFLMILNSCYNSREIDTKAIQEFSNNLIIAKGFNAKITKILPILDDLEVVVIEKPYREYPSIIVIKKDPQSSKWVRVFECLSPGIQDNPSGLLDWHTKGCGVDFEVDKESVYSFHSKIVTSLIESSLDKKGSVIIAYQNFIHMNTSDSTEQKSFEPYTIDKTMYYDFANDLMDNRYKGYSSKECIMFDSPKITDCSFTKEDGLFKISAVTNNHQIWIYTFDGVNNNFRFLTNKKIEVKKAR